MVCLALGLGGCVALKSRPLVDPVRGPRALVPQPRMSEPRWVAAVEQIEQDIAARPGAEVLLLGDSLTFGWRRHHQLAVKVFGGELINAGIIGDGTQHLLWRLQRGHYRALKPKRVVVLIGGNNGDARDRDLVRAIKTIMAEVQQQFPAAERTLLALLPAGRTADSPIRLRHRRINELIGGEEWPQTRVVTVGGSLLDQFGRLADHISFDGLHFKAAGYQRLATELQPHFPPITPPEG